MLDPNQFTFQNPKYYDVLDNILSKVTEEMDCELENVQVKVNKLFLYEENADDDGLVFENENTKIEDGHFATLVMQLPSVFKGHEFIVYSDGKSPKEIKFDVTVSQFEIMYTAFYNSCQHKMTQLKEGYRIVVTYDLFWVGECQPPNDQKVQQNIRKASHLLEKVHTIFFFRNLNVGPLLISLSGPYVIGRLFALIQYSELTQNEI